MGADLYMNQRYKSRLQKMKPEIDKSLEKLGDLTKGTIKYHREEENYFILLNKLQEKIYYRDAYNHESIAWALGLSWWNDVYPLLDEENKLSIYKTKKLIMMINSKNIEVSHELLEHYFSMEDARSFLDTKRNLLLSFLYTSIETGEEIYCSL